jgi:hypothetical protein
LNNKIILTHIIKNHHVLDQDDNRDIRDLEFSLVNNIKQLKFRAYTLSEREIQLVKLVLCSSLYPQLAIGDEHNPHRKSNEIVFQVPGRTTPL